MLYQILKIYARLAKPLFFHSLIVDKQSMLKLKGPLLIASNHPNSFLDAIIFDILFDLPITSLARGDAFQSKQVFRILRILKMLPIYRIREGAENLHINYQTFDACIEIFKKNEGVLIFSEGLCVNEWRLRPLKKGTARLALKAWKEGIPLKVLPAGINYSSFRRYGKLIHVRFGELIGKEHFDLSLAEGNVYNQFNELLQAQLQQLVYEIPGGNYNLLQEKFGKSPRTTKRVLAPLALMGALLHAPLYVLAKLITQLFFSKSIHFDAVIFALLFLSYPVYLLAITLLACSIWGGWGLLCLLLLFLTAACYVKYDIRLDK